MIYLYSGTPGSGKSLHVAQDISLALGALHPRPVICNFDINLRVIKRRGWEKLPFVYLDNSEITPEYLIHFAENYWNGRPVREDTILLVLDECQILFNSRNWQQSGRDKWLSFYTQHRKYGYQIILIAQFDRMIDRQIRSLIEYECIHRKLSNFGFWGKVLSAFAMGKLFISVQMWYPLKERVGEKWYLCRKKWYRLYDSYGKFNAAS